MNNLARAIEIAEKAHEGQYDKGGAPYILHPKRLMLAATSENAKIVAVLHDTVEDGEVTLEEIGAEFGPIVRNAVESLTRREEETYEAFIERCKRNPLAAEVKRLDIADNMNLGRLGRPATEKDLARIEKYKRALANL